MAFTIKQVASITGLSRRQVQFYTQEGVVVPEVDPGKGKGYARKYSWKNIREWLIIKKLVDFGLNIQRIRFVMEALANHPSNILTNTELLRKNSVFLIYQPSGIPHDTPGITESMREGAIRIEMVKFPFSDKAIYDDPERFRLEHQNWHNHPVLHVYDLQGEYPSALVIDLHRLFELERV
jgi:DNA-binding transcriptional MerR regulator